MSKIRKCLFPVAGFGSRFFPVTKSIPKEMLPIITKPLIHYAVEESAQAGLSSMKIVLSNNKKNIQNYFMISDNINSASNNNKIKELDLLIQKAEFDYIFQSEMLGLGHAIFIARNEIGEESFAVILPDDLCFNEGKSVIGQMIEIHERYPDYCIIAIEEVTDDKKINYGIVSGELFQNHENLFLVEKMIEKPEADEIDSNMGIIGRYILTPEIFSKLESTPPDIRGEIQITNALKKLAKEKKVLAYNFSGRRFDCGVVEGYIEANNFYLNLYKNTNNN